MLQLRDLNETERRVLLWLLATLTQVDGRIDASELEELRFVGSSLEIDLVPALEQALASFADRDEALAAARFARPDARDAMREVLDDLATGDGAVDPAEADLLAALTAAWSG